MPEGNAHALPHGFWYQEPTTSSFRKLFFGTVCRAALTFLSLFAVQQYRSMSYKYTYTNFIGKTMSLGNLSVLNHEPLTTEEVDRLKAEQAKP